MVIDIIFLIFLVWAIYRGYKNGFILSVFSILAIFVGIIGALKFSHFAAVHLHDWFNISHKYLPLISFIAVFIAILILVRLLSRIIEKFLQFVQLNIINKIGGAVLWSALITFLFSTILWFFYQAELVGQELQAESKVYGILEPISPRVLEVLSHAIPFLEGLYQSLELYFNQLYEETSPVIVWCY